MPEAPFISSFCGFLPPLRHGVTFHEESAGGTRPHFSVAGVFNFSFFQVIILEQTDKVTFHVGHFLQQLDISQYGQISVTENTLRSKTQEKSNRKFVDLTQYRHHTSRHGALVITVTNYEMLPPNLIRQLSSK